MDKKSFFFFLIQFTKQSTSNKAPKQTTMSNSGNEKKKRKRREKSKEEEQKQSSKNIETKKKRGRGATKKKVKDMSDEEKKKYQKDIRTKQMERRNVKQLGLGQDQCSYIKQLFSSLQMKAEESEHPKHTVQKDTITALDNLRECAISKILAQANIIQRGAKNGSTFGSRVAINAIRLSVPGDIFDYITSRGIEAVQRYKSRKHKDKEDTDKDDEEDDIEEDDEDDEGKPTRGGINVLSGLSLNVNRVITEMRARCTFSRYSPDAAIFITTALQVILEKIIILTLLHVSRRESAKPAPGGGVSREKITARDVRCAVENDGLDTCGKSEDVKTHFTRTGLSTFFNNATWSQVGTRRKEITV